MKETRKCFKSSCDSDIRTAKPILKPISHTDWGSWKEWKYCDANIIAIGYKFTWEPPQGSGGDGNDDSGGNGFWIRCSNNGNLIGHAGKWNVKKEERNCDKGSYVSAIEVNSEPDQKGGDDMALTNVRIWCRNPVNGKEKQLPTPSAPTPGKWTGKKTCPPYFGVSGVRVKIEPYQGGDDDSMLNKIEVRCSHILSFVDAIFVN